MKTNSFWEMGASVIAILFYLFLFYRTWHLFSVTGSWSGLLLLLFEGFVILLFLVRRMPKNVSISPYDWFIALTGTCLPTLFLATGGADTPLLRGLQIAGMLVSFIGALSLNRSFGLVAANRGVKTTGLYQYVRHPIYAGYFISFMAFFLQNYTVYNAVILILVYTFQILRIFAEEKFLKPDEAYQAYTQTVRWRLIPFIF